jgi:hypothetical protein
MEPTLLAGAVEFSPVDIAMILAVLAALALVVSAPGWLALAVVVARAAGPGASPARRWWRGVGGALAGIAVSAAVATVVSGLLDQVFSSAVPAVLAAWVTCWALAYAVRWGPGRPPAGTAPGSGEGWGR